MDRFGYPVRVVDPPIYPDTNKDPAVRQKCQWQIFKDPTKTPEEYYTRNGRTKPTEFGSEVARGRRPARSDRVRDARQRMMELPTRGVAMVIPGVGAPLELSERAVRPPAPGEALVRIEACGVCGSDVFLQDGGFGHDKYPSRARA